MSQAAGFTSGGALSNPVSPTQGGTGVSNPTAHTLPVAEGASNFNFLGPLTNGQLLIGSTGADPTAAVPTNGTNLTWSTGAGSLTANVSGPPSATTLTAHGVVVGAGTSPLTATLAGSAGQILQSGGAAADPVYSTATFPATATGTGKVLIADGTNWIASTPTYPNTSGTAGKVIISDGTNNVFSTPTFPNASATSGKFIRSDGTNWIASTPTLPTTAGTSGTVLRSDGTNFVNTTGFTVDSTGRMTNSAQPVFTAFLSTNPSNVTGDATVYSIIFDTADINQGTYYNTSTGIFTAPVTGTYSFTFTVTFSSLGSGHTNANLTFNSTLHNYNLVSGNPFAMSASGFLAWSGAVLAKMALNDTAKITVNVNNSTKTVGLTNNFTTFQGFLIA